MAQVLQLRRGTTAQNDTFTGAAGEVTVDTDRESLRVHDGVTMGGKEIAPLNVAIPLLADATTVNAADELIIQQGGITKRATASELLNDSAIVTATGSTTARTLAARGADVVNVKDFGAVGDGVTDDRPAINAAVNSAPPYGCVYIPAGRYLIREAILISRSDITLMGAGAGATTLLMADAGNLVNYSAIDIRTSRANNGAGGSLSKITIASLKIDGNKASRTTASGNGIIVLCDTAHAIGDVRVLDVHVSQCVGFGVLLQGFDNAANDGFRVERTIISNCSIRNNNGIGLSQFKTNNTTITACSFFNNGLENLTIDVYSQACIVDGNRFFRHLGGTGNIGVDSGDAAIISNNFIDNELNTTAAAGFRNGISLNSQLSSGGGNTDVVISGNVILNCSDCGVFAHDDTGGSFGSSSGGFTFGGDSVGSAVIVGNTFGANGTDVRIEPGAGPTIIKANKIQSIAITETQANDVRFGAGEIAWDAGLSGNQTVTLTSGNTDWIKVPLATIDARFATLTSNEIQLPAGGLYQYNATVRITGLTARSADWVSIAVRHTPTGGSILTRQIQNIDPNTGAFASDVTELNISGCLPLDAGVIGVYIRANVSSTGSVTVESDSSTKFTGAVLG